MQKLTIKHEEGELSFEGLDIGGDFIVSMNEEPFYLTKKEAKEIIKFLDKLIKYNS